MKTIVITGSSGFLGARAAIFFNNGYKVFAPKRNELDITNSDEVTKYIDTIKPDYVLHSAAISDITQAQNNRELSNATNKLAPIYFATACKNTGAKLVNLSSDQVYTGNKERVALVEDVALTPQNLYAEQKLEAEMRIKEILPNAVSLRLTWMYDKISSDVTPNKGLLTNLLIAKQSNKPYRVNSNQMRSISYIKNVVENLPLCFELPGGIYNYGSENELSVCELIGHAATLMGLDLNLIEPYAGDEQNILINTDKLKASGIILPSAKDALHQAID